MDIAWMRVEPAGAGGGAGECERQDWVKEGTEGRSTQALIPPALHTLLWIARLLGAVPARMVRKRTGWRLSVAPALVKLQRLIVVMTCIQYINQCHGEICDIVGDINDNEGPFLLISFMYLFLQLLTMPQELIVNYGSSPTYEIIFRINTIFVTFLDVLVMVEPCQRLQDQMVRTRNLLVRLESHTQDEHCGLDWAQLDLFSLQAQLREAGISPMGVIAITRPTVASLIGGVVTFLVIVFQITNTSKTTMS
ncbi:uncharacterized protein LOC125226533 [Leguminivora glycinivorella]|uniref:uncharacterized protein LOC125226533 n=1 Tax=Leguminivora glycinivorella TaxID=1035111 RepID=UPI00200E44D4|nr:uncharacterized protein LOC125226533 [Leguminivora glycinivorella]